MMWGPLDNSIYGILVNIAMADTFLTQNSMESGCSVSFFSGSFINLYLILLHFSSLQKILKILVFSCFTLQRKI